jgi:hypothetical protein
MNPQQPSQPRGGLLGLFDKAMKVDDDTGLSPLQNFAAALDPLILKDLRGGEGIRQQGVQRAATMSKNKTVDMLRQQGREDLANAVRNGTINFKEAFSVMQSEKAADLAFKRQQMLAGSKNKDTALMRQAIAAGLKPGSPEYTRYIVSGGDIYSQETALLQMLPKPEKGMTYSFDRDQSGKISGYKLVPIPGGSVEREMGELEARKAEAEQTQQQKDISFYSAGERVLGQLGKEDAYLPATGIAAETARKIPFIKLFAQRQENVAEDLAIMESQMQFETLSALKAASPSGASGLGQLTDAERRALGKIQYNFASSQDEPAIERTIRSAMLMKSYFENGLYDPSINGYRNATDAEIDKMAMGINPFSNASGPRLKDVDRFLGDSPASSGVSSGSVIDQADRIIGIGNGGTP